MPNRNCQSDGLAHRNNFSKWISMLRKLTKAAKFINWAGKGCSKSITALSWPASPCLWQWPVPGSADRGARTAKPFLITGILLFPLSCTQGKHKSASWCGTSEGHLSLQTLSSLRISLLGDSSDLCIVRLRKWWNIKWVFHRDSTPALGRRDVLPWQSLGSSKGAWWIPCPVVGRSTCEKQQCVECDFKNLIFD